MKLMGGYNFPGSLVDRFVGLSPSLIGLTSGIQASIFSKFWSFISWAIDSNLVFSAFIGWIPEYIDIKRFVLSLLKILIVLFKYLIRSNFEREKTWERIQNGFSRGISNSFRLFLFFFLIHAGQCVVTLGTGPEFDNRWRDIHLLPSHSYAVIGESCRVNPLAVQLSVYNRCA